MAKPASTLKNLRKKYKPEFRQEALILAEQDEELGILHKAATYFAKRLK
jgi:transposase-like protein